MKKTERQLWEAADSLLGGQLFLEEEEQELMSEPEMEPDQEMGEPVDLDEPMPEMDEDEGGMSAEKLMRVIDDIAAESDDETKDEFLKNLSAELEDDSKMESMMAVLERVFEDMGEEEDDMGGEEDDMGEEDVDVDDIDLPSEDEI
jgi:ligand-binding sensor protein